VKNVALGDKLNSAPGQDLAAPWPRRLPCCPAKASNAIKLCVRRSLPISRQKSAIEWLLAVDRVELSWEIERYRLLRHRVLMQYREKAIEQSCAGSI